MRRTLCRGAGAACIGGCAIEIQRTRDLREACKKKTPGRSLPGVASLTCAGTRSVRLAAARSCRRDLQRLSFFLALRAGLAMAAAEQLAAARTCVTTSHYPLLYWLQFCADSINCVVAAT